MLRAVTLDLSMFTLLIHLMLADGNQQTPPPERIARLEFASIKECTLELHRWWLIDPSDLNLGDVAAELAEAEGDPRWMPYYAECIPSERIVRVS
jgi:hypothetical protein